MGTANDAFFELKLIIDRAVGMFMGSKKKYEPDKYCPACGTRNPGPASNCSKCYRSFNFINATKIQFPGNFGARAFTVFCPILSSGASF